MTATEQPLGCELYVENEGLSIEAEEIDRLAERGWRGPSTRGVAANGSGIGLWVVDGIMRTLGGRLVPTPTTPDNRTRVRLWFPGSRAQRVNKRLHQPERSRRVGPQISDLLN